MSSEEEREEKARDLQVDLAEKWMAEKAKEVDRTLTDMVALVDDFGDRFQAHFTKHNPSNFPLNAVIGIGALVTGMAEFRRRARIVVKDGESPIFLRTDVLKELFQGLEDLVGPLDEEGK